MEFLIIGGAHIGLLSNTSNITNDDRLHALYIQHGNQVRRLLVFDVLNLMLHLPELFLLGANEVLPPSRALLRARNLAIHLCHELMAILPF